MRADSTEADERPGATAEQTAEQTDERRSHREREATERPLGGSRLRRTYGQEALRLEGIEGGEARARVVDELAHRDALALAAHLDEGEELHHAPAPS